MEHGQHRDYDALSRYYGLDGGRRYILEDIGRDFGLTRERVRQLRNRLKTRITQFLVGDGNEGAGQLSREARAVKRLLTSGSLLQRETDIAAQLSERYGSELDARELAALPLLLDVLGIHSYTSRSLGFKENHTYRTPHGPLDTREVRAMTEAICEHFATNPEGTTWYALSVAATRAVGRDVSLEETRAITKGILAVKEVGNGVWVRFDHLATIACRAYRVLYEAGDPLHFREIAARIARNFRELGIDDDGPDALGISKHLSLDDRFQPVGRSGRWMLRRWRHVRGDPVATLMEEILEESGEPMSHDEVWEFIHKLRPDVQRSTMSALVHVFSDRFVRLTRNRLALAKWKIDPREVKPKRPLRRPPVIRTDTVRARVAEIVRQVLREYPNRTTKLRELRKTVGSRASVKDPTVYWVVNAMEDTVKSDVGNVRYVRLVEAGDE